MDIAERIAKLPPEKRKVFEAKLLEQGVDILQLPISRVDRTKRDQFPLSFAQERLWFIQQLEPGSTAYNVILTTRLQGNLDKTVLEKTLTEIINRHEILRTSFVPYEEKPVQVVHPGMPLPLEVIDLKGFPKEEFDQQLQEVIREESLVTFELDVLPLLKVKLLELNVDDYIFLLVTHHIIFDGSSVQLFIRELAQLYDAFSRGMPSPLAALPVQFIDYACWQRERLQGGAGSSGKLQKQEDYWLEQFPTAPPLLELPTDYPRPKMLSSRGSSREYLVDQQLTTALKELAKNEQVTLFTLLLTLFYVFLSRLSGSEDITLGTPTAGRNHSSLQDMIGMFVNTLAIRNFPHPGQSFRDFLAAVKHRSLDAFDNQDYRFEDIVNKVDVVRDTSRNPLFDVMFVFQNFEFTQVELPGLTFTTYERQEVSAAYDLLLKIAQKNGQLRVIWIYCSDLFQPSRIELFESYFLQLIQSVLAEPGQLIGQLQVLPVEERKRIVYDFNETATDYPFKKTIQALFEEQVEKKAGAIAIAGPSLVTCPLEEKDVNRKKAFKDCQLTYVKLNQEAENLAAVLLEKGTQLGDIVAVMLERSIEMILAVTGIVKAGAAYLPVDPDYPKERIDYILKDSAVEIVISPDFIYSSNESNKSYKPDRSYGSYKPYSPPGGVCAANTAYVIYTSGSTGRPKGVMVDHRAVVRLVKNTDYFAFKEKERLLQTVELVFDVSTFEIWGTLLNGLSMHVTQKEHILDPFVLEELILRYQIMTMWLTAPLFNRLFTENNGIFSNLETFLTGGDVLSPPHINSLKKKFPNLNIINGYGPTENTTFSTTFLVDREYPDNIPIGKPVANSTAYILDKNGRLQPIGVPGELLVGGDGLALGYLNNPELTANKFVASGGSAEGRTFKKVRSKHQLSGSAAKGDRQDLKESSFAAKRHNKNFVGGPGGRFFKRAPLVADGKLYKTGDLCRWLPDGNIEFLGRIDTQVKIRGFRIECGEIENGLLEHEQVKEAVVIDRVGDSGDKYLCAYIVPVHTGTSASAGEIGLEKVLQAYLSGKLPGYMVPQHFVFLEHLPLNTSGKTDRSALPEPGIKTANRYTPPRNETEKELLDLWSELLQTAEPGVQVGIDDNFFHLGGHSLKATVLIARIRKVFDVQVSLAEIFKAPTVRRMAELIHQQEKGKYQGIPAAEEKEYYVLTPAQRRLFLLQQMEPGSTAYNLPSFLKAPVQLDKEKLGSVFRQLIARHDSLRTSFHVIDEQPVQKIHSPGEIKFSIERISSTNIIHNFISPFDLSLAPLLRVALLEVDAGETILLVDMHHIITDAVSQAILIEEFEALYNGGSLTGVATRYRDYAEWYYSSTFKEKLRGQEQFWLKQFASDLPQVELPTDFPRTADVCAGGGVIKFNLSIEQTHRLKELAREEGVTLFMVLLAVTNIFLAKIGCGEDIIIGTPTAGRMHPDVQRIIGMFVATLALRNYPRPGLTFLEFLKDLEKRTLAAFDNQDYPFEDLVDRLGMKRSAGRNPLFDVMFALLDLPRLQSEKRPIEGQNGDIHLERAPVEYRDEMVKFDLGLDVIVSDELLFIVTFDSRLFKHETIEQFSRNIQEIITCVLDNRNILLPGIVISHQYLETAPVQYEDDEGDFVF